MTVLDRKDYPFRRMLIAADARLCQTSYTDDQVWELALGEPREPGLTLATRYGGRVGSARIVTGVTLGSRSVLEAQTFTERPRITAFAPNYVLVEAGVMAGLHLEAEYWVKESSACGARLTFTNTGSSDLTVKALVQAEVTLEGEDAKPPALAVLTMAGGGNALLLGNYPRLQPVILLDGGQASAADGRGTARLTVEVTVPAGGTASARWVHAGSPEMQHSVEQAEYWLAQDWDHAFAQIAAAAQAVPVLTSSDPEVDRLVALSYQYLLQAFINATDSLPHPTVITRRTPSTGFSAAGDGSDHERGWTGQSVQTAYLTGLSVASIEPAFAEGLLLNYLAVQERSGSVDARPGPGGQRAGYDVAPLLGRMAWRIFRYTGNAAFLKKVLPKLMLFYRYYMHLDDDHLPQWADERQMGYPYFPTFGLGKPWAQNADIRRVECIDMATYLLSEGLCLSNIARYLRVPDFENEIQHFVEQNRIRLDDLWRGGRYQYRDYETRKPGKPVTLLTDGRGDEEHFITEPLERAARLIVRITGGTDRAPKCSVQIDGLDASGKPQTETFDQTRIQCFRGYGIFTTDSVFKQVDRVAATGLSRVLTLTVTTVDHTRSDITGLLPLASMGGITQDRAAALVKTLTDPKRFWRPNGLSMVPATDEDFDPSNQKGGGGVWLLWNGMLGEGLCDYGYVDEATALLKRILKCLVAVVEQDGHFHEFYDSDTARGWGEPYHVNGIVPLHLLRRVLSIRILSNSLVLTGDRYVWDSPVTVRQHGVTVERSTDGTRVTFPSGTVVDLPADAEWQQVVDPNPAPQITPERLRGANITPDAPAPGKVLIQVEVES